MRCDLVVVGNLLIDELPGPLLRPGGAALYTALAARSCGLEVAVHSVVGNDYPLEALEKAGVHLSLTRLEGPGGRAILEYGPEGRSLVHRGPGHGVMSPDSPHPFKASLVHIAPMPIERQLYHLSHCPSGTALLDPYPRMDDSYAFRLRPYHGKLKALILNQEELDLPASQVADSVLTVVKEGAQGGYTLNPTRRWRPTSTVVVDPTGAGDAFAGGLAAGFVFGHTLEQALQLAAECAGRTVSAEGVAGLLA